MVYNRLFGVFQFEVNVSVDTLNTNANFKKWEKCSDSKCVFCGQLGIPHPLFNFCFVALDR